MKTIISILLFVSSLCYSQWQADIRLTNSLAHSEFSALAVSGTVVHVVWQDDRDGNYEIYYKRSANSGANWGSDTRLTNFTLNSMTPAIAVSGQSVHVVWMDFRDGNREIYYKLSTDGGSSWGTDVRLTNNSSLSQAPSVIVSGTAVHVVWDDYRDGNYEIYYKRSTDGGLSWGSDTRLTNYSAASNAPTIAVSGNNVHVVWVDERDGNPEIYYKRSSDGGLNWSTDTRLTNNISYSASSSITVSAAMIHVVWEDKRDGGNAELYYKRSTDGGLNWGTDSRLTNNTANSEAPSAMASGMVIHIVWQDERDGNLEVYYKRSTDGGVSWSADARLTNNIHVSAQPSVAASGTIVHVIWEDTRDGDYEIYYKLDPTGNPVSINNISSEIPDEFSLSQNYPNPFNPMTNIKFDVPATPQSSGKENVILKIYNVLGKEITTLVDKELSPGTYEVNFDGTNYPSGIYYCRMSFGESATVNKMILLK
ncbi:MAG: T9SS type A sorting domain-containing protein [Ignavibacteria bacterium]|nr:T9SS type A sorting domain-containing protein [Ignavibacteria bacterium]